MEERSQTLFEYRKRVEGVGVCIAEKRIFKADCSGILYQLCAAIALNKFCHPAEISFLQILEQL